MLKTRINLNDAYLALKKMARESARCGCKPARTGSTVREVLFLPQPQMVRNRTSATIFAGAGMQP
jgi:hypothetical protein